MDDPGNRVSPGASQFGRLRVGPLRRPENDAGRPQGAPFPARTPSRYFPNKSSSLPAASNVNRPVKHDACALADERTVRLLVGLAKIENVTQLNGFLEGIGQTTPIVPGIRLAIVQVIGGDAIRVLERLREQSWVRYAQLDSFGVICAGPNDPEFVEQPALDRIGAPAAWATATGGTTVTVAILDTGVDSNHEDLLGTLLPGRSFVPSLFSQAGQPDWADDNGHGTKVAGLIAARRDNAIGIAGMCRDCRILPVKVADANGHVRYGDLAQGIVFATDSGARIINISLAGRANSEAVEDAIDSTHGSTGCWSWRPPARRAQESWDFPPITTACFP